MRDTERRMSHLRGQPLDQFIISCAYANESMQRGPSLAGHEFNAIMTLHTFAPWMEANGFEFDLQVAETLAVLRDQI